MHQILDLTKEQNESYRILFMETLEDNIRDGRKLDFDLTKAQVEHGMYFGERMLDTAKAKLFKQELSTKEVELFNKIVKMYDNALEFGQRFTVEDYKKFL